MFIILNKSAYLSGLSLFFPKDLIIFTANDLERKLGQQVYIIAHRLVH